jgi:hypothetical protein
MIDLPRYFSTATVKSFALEAETKLSSEAASVKHRRRRKLDKY